jgi:hypothetical protein
MPDPAAPADPDVQTASAASEGAEPDGAVLRWPVRASFLRYVAALPDARASVSEGARLTTEDPQVVVYPADPGAGTPSVLAFRGDLRLSGHGGLLFVRLAEPRIEPAAEGPAVLSVADPLDESGGSPRLPLVDLVLRREGDDWSGTEVRLRPEGVPLFNHVYAAGDPFDPLRVVAAAAPR